MGVETAIGIGSLIIGAAGTAYSVSEQNKNAERVRSAQKDKQKMEMAMQNEQALREKRAQIREARIQRAMVENLGAVSGQGEGSAAIYGGQQATQQSAVNIGNISTQQSFANVIGTANQEIASAKNQGSSLFGSLAGNVGGMLLSSGVSYGTEKVSSIFKD